MNSMDTYMSFGMYTGNDPQLIITMNDETAAALPENAKGYLQTGVDFELPERDEGSDWSSTFTSVGAEDRNMIDAFGWCSLDLGAQPYPAPRTYKALGCAVCKFAVKAKGPDWKGPENDEEDALGVRLLLLEKLDITQSYKMRRRTVYTCKALGCDKPQ